MYIEEIPDEDRVVSVKWKHEDETEWHSEDVYLMQVDKLLKKLHKQGYSNKEIEAIIR